MIVLKNVRILDPCRQVDELGDLVMEAGKIARVGAGAGDGLNQQNVQIVDGTGMWATPGFVDLHVHFREPGQEYKEDIRSGLRAAAHGGYTDVCAMPNTRPTNDHRAVTELMIARSKEHQGVRLHPFGAITMGLRGDELTEMADLKEGGAVGVSDDGRCVMNARVMQRALEYASTFDLLVSQHCEDHHLTDGGQMHEGAISSSLGLKGWPREAEDIIVARDLILAHKARARYHVAHISTVGALELVRAAKSRGQAVSAEVTPHHLFLTDHAVLGYKTDCKVNPPLREEHDILALRQGLKDGTLDCVATDHAPHSPLEKDCEFDAAAPGMVGLETALPLLLSLVKDGTLSPLRFVEVMATAPAKLAGLGRRTLSVGEPADITLIAPEQEWIFDRRSSDSKSLNSPWLGHPMRGRCEAVWVKGKAVFSRFDKTP